MSLYKHILEHAQLDISNAEERLVQAVETPLPEDVLLAVTVDDGSGNYTYKHISVEDLKALLFKSAINVGDGSIRGDLEAVPVGAAGGQTSEFMAVNDFFQRITLHPMQALTGGTPDSFRVRLGDNSGTGTLGTTTPDTLRCGFYDSNLNLIGTITYSFTAGQTAQTLIANNPTGWSTWVGAAETTDAGFVLPSNYLVSLSAYVASTGVGAPLVLEAYDSIAFFPGSPIGTLANKNYVLGWASASNFSADQSVPLDPFVIDVSITDTDQLTLPHVNMKG